MSDSQGKGLYFSEEGFFPKPKDKFFLHVPQQPSGKKSFSSSKLGKKCSIINLISPELSGLSHFVSPFLRQTKQQICLYSSWVFWPLVPFYFLWKNDCFQFRCDRLTINNLGKLRERLAIWWRNWEDYHPSIKIEKVFSKSQFFIHSVCKHFWPIRLSI